MTDSEKELIKLGAKTTPPLVKDYLDIALYAGSKMAIMYGKSMHK